MAFFFLATLLCSEYYLAQFLPMHDAVRTGPLFVGAITALKLGLSLALAHYHARKLKQRIGHSPQWKRLREKVRDYRDLSFGDPEDALKYLTLDFWLREHIRRAVGMGVHRRQRMKILDLGCGSGLFPFICRCWGHDAAGLDKPIAVCRPAEAIVYSVMLEMLGVSVTRSMISAHERMNVHETYDLITAFNICFNQHKQANEWGEGDWKFFLLDVATDLNPGGSVYLLFNRHEERYGDLRFWDPETLRMFETCGEVDRAEGTAIFCREDIIRTLGPAPGVTRPLANTPTEMPVPVSTH